jgi:acyl-CoA synthetase (AMP-forming)/AMP-acid ligase II
VIGGSACPPAMMDTLIDDFGVRSDPRLGHDRDVAARHGRRTADQAHVEWPKDQQRKILQKQGHAIFGVDMKIVGDDGVELPWDGVSYGNLLVKGPWIISRYFKDEGGDVLENGWFPTGDVATIDPDGFMQITDRSKDVIKSGGEWIGTIDLENIAMSHPAVMQAACIGVFHPKWDERPLLVVVRRPGQQVDRETLLEYFHGKVARWWIPDDVVFAEALPVGGTGKIQKNKLREQYQAHQLPSI